MMFWATLTESSICLKENFKKLRKKLLISHYFFLSDVTPLMSYQIPNLPGIGLKRKKIVLQKVNTPDSFS